MASKRQFVEEQIPDIQLRFTLSLNELVEVLRNLDEEDREFLLENLIAALSPDYLKSIEEARRDYMEGRILSHEEVFQ